jgi:TetR/AcrR family transcriptional repressor of bet genes
MGMADLPDYFIMTVMPKLVDHDERRSEIAAAAAGAIDELGLDRVRLVDVAKRASCTTGAVRHYFPDKEAVLGAALEHVLGNLTTYAPDSQAWPEAASPVESFLAVLSEILPLDEVRRSDWRVWIAFCGRAVSTPTLAALHRDAYAEIQQVLAIALVNVGVATTIPDAEQLAVSVIASLDGLGLRATLEPEEWSSERLRSMLFYQLAPLLRAERTVDDFETNPHSQEKTA